tara:strand:- start:588 stop:1199 length:612 start_codon:yes stop_codon:yes gene_type:complete
MATTGIYSRLFRPDATREESNDIAHSDQVSEVVSSFSTLSPGSVLEEVQTSSNSYNLVTGKYGAFEHSAPHGSVRGVVSGAVFGKKCKVSAHAVITGVTFTDDGSGSDAELVHVESADGLPVGVSFISCAFIRSSTSPAEHVLVDSGNKVIFIGCTFRGKSQSSGNVINNAGAAGNVQAIGCFNFTAESNLGANVTNVGVLKV